MKSATKYMNGIMVIMPAVKMLEITKQRLRFSFYIHAFTSSTVNFITFLFSMTLKCSILFLFLVFALFFFSRKYRCNVIDIRCATYFGICWRHLSELLPLTMFGTTFMLSTDWILLGLYLYMLVVETFSGDNIKFNMYAGIGWGKFN